MISVLNCNINNEEEIKEIFENPDKVFTEILYELDNLSTYETRFYVLKPILKNLKEIWKIFDTRRKYDEAMLKCKKRTEKKQRYQNEVYDKYSEMLANLESFSRLLERKMEKPFGESADVKIKMDETQDKNKGIIQMQWQGPDTLLIFLFVECHRLGLISKNDLDRELDFIVQSFRNKKGNEFKKKNLIQSKNNLLLNKDGKPRNHFMIEQAIKADLFK